MNRNIWILSAVIILSAALALTLATRPSTRKAVSKFSLSPTPIPTVSTNPSVSEIPATTTPASSANVEVISPSSGNTVKSGFVVRGNARVFESVVSIRLSEKNGPVLVQTTAMANAPDAGQFGAFEKALIFSTSAKDLVLEVYQASPKDGSDIDKVTIPLKVL